MTRGINFGNALDATEGDPAGLRLREAYFDEVKLGGFDTVRVPVKWSAHAGAAPPYAIDPAFLARVDWAVDQALQRDLDPVIDVHHFHELNDAPDAHAARFLSLWRQIGAHYAARPARLRFELLNEPRPPMTAEQWNALLPRAVATVRESNPDRWVIVGPVQMNDIAALPDLVLPDDDRLIVTVHYYAPFEFTHQGAHWVAGADEWLGTGWGSEADRDAVRLDLERAAAWACERGRPLFVGELGTYERADLDARVRWTDHVRSEIERLELGGRTGTLGRISACTTSRSRRGVPR